MAEQTALRIDPRYVAAAARYRIVLSALPHNWGAYAPAVLGCVATGKTAAAAAASMREALALHLELMEQQGEPWPDPLVEYALDAGCCQEAGGAE
jgi:predicted RNase H-like HicB family nuclease